MRSTEREAQTWEPVSGMTVKRTVSSSRRTQAIFSRELRAATSSGGRLCQRRKVEKGDGMGWGGVGLLEKVRIFRRSVLNRISSWYHVKYPMLWVDMEYVEGNGVCREDGLPEFVNFQEEGKVASRLGAHTFPPL